MTARLILSIVSDIFEEVALVVVWRWGLPQLGIHLHVSILIAVMVAWAAYSLITYRIGSRALRRQTPLGLPSLVGGTAKVTKRLDPEGMVMIEGELWQAKSEEGNVDIGEEVMVVHQNGLKLMVRKVGKSG